MRKRKSTKRLGKTPIALKMMRLYLKSLSVISTSQAVAVVWDKLLRPKKPVWRQYHNEIRETASEFTFQIPPSVHSSRPLALRGYNWGAGEKTVLLVHGWESKALSFYAWIDKLSKQGFRVVAFDMPAHGYSEGLETSLIQFKDVISTFISEHGLPNIIIGHSLGGAASLLSLVENQQVVEKLIMVNSPVAAKYFFLQAADILELKPKVRKGLFTRLRNTFGKPIDFYSLNNSLDKIPMSEVTVMHDRHDKVVPFPLMEELCHQSEKLNLIPSEGLGHNGVLKNESFLELLIEQAIKTNPADNLIPEI